MKTRMKMILAVVLVLSLFISAMPSGLASSGYEDWLVYCYAAGTAPSKPARHIEEFRPWLLNHNFPTRVLRDVTYECKSWNGYPINGLAIDLSGGINMRSTPDYSNNRNIVLKIHGDVTVYIYFELFNQYGTHWYYGVTESGVEGYLAASRIQLER